MAAKSGPKKNPICEIQVEKSIAALKEYLKEVRDGKKLLLEDTEKIYMIFSLKKLLPVAQRRWKQMKVIFPHMPEENPSVCLFVKDLGKGKEIDDDKSIWHFKQILTSHNITNVSEIIPFHMLRTHYKPYETKRHLANSHNSFFCDDRIQAYLPKILGKEFLRKHQMPIKLDLDSKSLSREFSKALHTVNVHLNSLRVSYHLKIGHSGLSEKQLIDNFLMACKVLKKFLPGGWVHIKSLHVKSETSPAFPVYISTVSGKEVKFQKQKRKLKIVTDELSTFPSVDVSVYPDGRIKLNKRKNEMDDTDDAECDVKTQEEKLKKTKDELEDFENKHITKRQKMLAKQNKKS